MKEIAQKYKNAQEGVGDMMSGVLVETSASRLKNEASELSVAEVEQPTGIKIV